MKKRPAGVPKQAVWNQQNQEWELGQKKNGIEIGEWKWWRPTGELVCHSFRDTEGKLQGKAERFHPNGELSFLAYYNHGVEHGKQIWTIPSAGNSPENPAFPKEPKGLYRVELVFINGKPEAATFYNKKGLEPILSDENGFSIDLGSQLDKLFANTIFLPRANEVNTIVGKVLLNPLIQYVFAGLALKNGTIYRIKCIKKDKKEEAIIVEAKEISKAFTLAVDKIHADLFKK